MIFSNILLVVITIPNFKFLISYSGHIARRPTAFRFFGSFNSLIFFRSSNLNRILINFDIQCGAQKAGL